MQASYNRVLAYFRPDRRQILAVVTLMVLATAAGLLKPWPIAWIIDSVLGDQPWAAWIPDWLQALNPVRALIVLTMLLALVHWSQAALNTLFRFLTIRVSLRGLTRVRSDVFECLQRLSLRQRQTFAGGDLIHRASWDTFSIQTIFEQGMIAAVSSSLTLVLMWVILARINLELSLVALSIVPILSIAMRRYGTTMRDSGLQARKAESRVTSSVEQNIRALSLIQSYNRESFEKHRFGSRVLEAQQKRQAQHSSELSYLLAIALIFGTGLALVVWLGGRKVLEGDLTVGELMVFLMYLMQLYEPLNQLSHVGATVATASAGSSRVFELLDSEVDVQEAPNAKTLVSARGNLVFEKVDFRYAGGRKVFDGASFSIEPGAVTSVIGPSGIGKTTLIYLLVRFMDPSSGRILLDGVDLRQLKLKDLRAQISLVPQEPLLLPGTVAENIAMGKPGAAIEEIREAARLAHADEFIRRLKSGYDSLVGDGATQFSTGERQRINLARAFLKDAPILLMDEPTSALDSESEAKVLDGIVRLSKGRTVLIAAHRASTMQIAENTLLVQHGSVRPAANPWVSIKGA